MRLLRLPAILARFALLGPWQLVYAIARFIVSRSWWFIFAAIGISVLLAPGLGMLQTDSGFDTLVSPKSQVFKDTRQLHAEFGGDPIAVVLSGPLDDIFSPGSLDILNRFEEKFSPEKDARVHAVLTPVSILKLASAEAGKLGHPMEWNDPVIVRAVIGDSYDSMRPEMAGLVPDDHHVLLTVTYAGDIDYETSLQLLRDIGSFFEAPQNQISGSSSFITSDLELMDEISGAIGSNMARLLAMSVGVMALILIIAFRVRWNLLALLMVGLAALWTFGIMGYLGVSMSMATMAVLPVLFGLGIDYSIQFHKRYQEEACRVDSVDEALTMSTARMFPSVGIALLATLIGFITLYISDVPMIRDFGLVLAIGMLLSYLIAFFTLNSIIRIHERRLRTISLGRAAQAATRYMEKGLSVMARLALKVPLVILILSVSAAVAGSVVDHWLPSNSDFESLMPQGSQVLQEMDELREVQGFVGRVRFIATADDVTDPAVLKWLQTYQAEMMDLYGRTGGHAGQNLSILDGVDSPVTLITQETGGNIPDREGVDSILAQTPAVFRNQFITADRKSANISFYASYDSVDDVEQVIGKMMRAARDEGLPGVRIAPAGTTALAAKALSSMIDKRFLMNELCLGATFVVLILVYRRLTLATFTIIPVGLVIGWSSLDMYLFGMALNPMTAVLGVLVIGVGTEFMVLILGRYREERTSSGMDPREAMVTAISTTGQAIVATALTTLGGFGILISSDFVLIRDFGAATTMAVFLCLVGSMVVMPPLIVWWDRRVETHLPKWF